MSGLPEVIVVGAGVAGLTFGRELQSRGYSVVILERARGVGGRCATRRVVDQPVDHGLPFLHGRGERFLAELDAVPGVTVVRGWPNIVEGDGLPCRPEAFTDRERRLTFIEGVSQFPKHLSRGLDVPVIPESGMKQEALPPSPTSAPPSSGHFESPFC